MASPLVLTASQVTVIENANTLLNKAWISGVTDGSGNQLVPACPPLPQYNTLNSLIQAQSQAAMCSSFAALVSALNVTSGASGTITIPKIVSTQGSITVVNGIITAFTNPT